MFENTYEDCECLAISSNCLLLGSLKSIALSHGGKLLPINANCVSCLSCLMLPLGFCFWEWFNALLHVSISGFKLLFLPVLCFTVSRFEWPLNVVRLLLFIH